VIPFDSWGESVFFPPCTLPSRMFPFPEARMVELAPSSSLCFYPFRVFPPLHRAESLCPLRCAVLERSPYFKAPKGGLVRKSCRHPLSVT